ncbi:probable leucine-rich repeat receptor-like serine/threonine-protein kinase At3g14840 isoform X2 [Malania oleifera]|uniref:probable leucine-rich repeat receptor-like serine/threonine-protein kinase At3g14840 isoform X2 n=1 Tax=Malania oleifera TaxID=397392 RepID=UPI0025AE9B8E|nr:probable leucine-rich repeat receptor-like serine/threonine-protein kinase At3g14840 isoform X2 [Malania oleifera]
MPASSSSSPRLLPLSAAFICLFSAFSVTGATAATTKLPIHEVEALREIGKRLEKKDWNFSVDPCGGEGGWAVNTPIGFETIVTCICSLPVDNDCHVVSIALKGQNLQGTLPPELAKLSYLQQIDLSRNYLHGTIPPEWGSLPLVNITLGVNRLTGSIPKEIGNISTLASLTLTSNQLSGVLPPELGNLFRLRYLNLSSNYFTGELPGTFAKLTALNDVRISDNNLTGSIPNFIQNWKNLRRLVILGTGLKGPIPSGLSLLENISELKISDLNGTEESFPRLSNVKSLMVLVLRSCNIVGPLPDYIGDFENLRTLDLSFNKLSGEIPDSYFRLSKLNYLYLTGNLITGALPDWMPREGYNIDLSYNNLTFNNPGALGCQQNNLSLEGNNSGIVSCLGSFRCPRNWHSFHINCGGKEVTDEDGSTTYEDDTDGAGPSKFIKSRTNWALSNTGNFDMRSSNGYVATNVSGLSMKNSDLYMTARISPLSLAYYGFCLLNGNYTVSLYFAEIMFIDNRTYCSLGRRIFDVYIQGKLVLKDFNIEDEAGGLRKEIIKNFTAVVTNNNLEIRFYWPGKGTTSIPIRGVYGPLISAISVKSDFVPPDDGSRNVAVVTGLVTAGTFLIFFVLSIVWLQSCPGLKDMMYQDLKGLDLQTGSLTLRQIKIATNNFDDANKIGEGGFGSVYKGLLSDGTIIAVKQLSSKSKQGNREFVNEIGMISALQHPHLVKLYGCCIEGNQLLLVYEYMENNSLARALFGPTPSQLKLDWPTRQKICVGIARGLAYLHEESTLKIVHRDIKATNVLLDKHLNPKISDFGLAKLDEEGNTHMSTHIAGTYGYMAPEYAMHGYLTDKADVYSFGIVALEIVSGRRNTSYRANENCFDLLDWALLLKEKGDLMELVDPMLGSDYNKEEVMTIINVGLLCTSASATARPRMSSVVGMLEGRAVVPVLVSESNVSDEEMKLQAMKDYYQFSHEHKFNEMQAHGSSTYGPWTDYGTCSADPFSLGSHYFQKEN